MMFGRKKGYTYTPPPSTYGPMVKVEKYLSRGAYERGANQMVAKGYRVESVVTTGHDMWGNPWLTVTYVKSGL